VNRDRGAETSAVESQMRGLSSKHRRGSRSGKWPGLAGRGEGGKALIRKSAAKGTAIGGGLLQEKRGVTASLVSAFGEDREG